MILALPETNRALIGNGAVEPPKLLHPMLKGIMRPWKGYHGPSVVPPPRGAKRMPNPLQSVRVLLRKDVAVSIMPGSFLYTVYCCVHTSLSSTFIDSYHLEEWRVGLIYLPFGIGAIIATLMSSKWIDRDYRIVAKAHGLPIDKVSGNDLLHFPIEEARMRGAFAPMFCASVSVIIYGWLVNEHIVSARVYHAYKSHKLMEPSILPAL